MTSNEPPVATASSSSGDAKLQNAKTFRSFLKKLQSSDPANYNEASRLLVTWLGDARAYYEEARPWILKFLGTAQMTLRTSVGLAEQHSFHVSLVADTSFTDAYINLVRTVVAFRSCFEGDKSQLELLDSFHRSIDAANVSQNLPAASPIPAPTPNGKASMHSQHPPIPAQSVPHQAPRPQSISQTPLAGLQSKSTTQPATPDASSDGQRITSNTHHSAQPSIPPAAIASDASFSGQPARRSSNMGVNATSDNVVTELHTPGRVSPPTEHATHQQNYNHHIAPPPASQPVIPPAGAQPSAPAPPTISSTSAHIPLKLKRRTKRSMPSADILDADDVDAQRILSPPVQSAQRTRIRREQKSTSKQTTSSSVDIPGHVNSQQKVAEQEPKILTESDTSQVDLSKTSCSSDVHKSSVSTLVSVTRDQRADHPPNILRQEPQPAHLPRTDQAETGDVPPPEAQQRKSQSVVSPRQNSPTITSELPLSQLDVRPKGGSPFLVHSHPSLSPVTDQRQPLPSPHHQVLPLEASSPPSETPAISAASETQPSLTSQSSSTFKPSGHSTPISDSKTLPPIQPSEALPSIPLDRRSSAEPNQSPQEVPTSQDVQSPDRFQSGHPEEELSAEDPCAQQPHPARSEFTSLRPSSPVPVDTTVQQQGSTLSDSQSSGPVGLALTGQTPPPISPCHVEARLEVVSEADESPKLTAAVPANIALGRIESSTRNMSPIRLPSDSPPDEDVEMREPDDSAQQSQPDAVNGPTPEIRYPLEDHQTELLSTSSPFVEPSLINDSSHAPARFSVPEDVLEASNHVVDVASTVQELPLSDESATAASTSLSPSMATQLPATQSVANQDVVAQRPDRRSASADAMSIDEDSDVISVEADLMSIEEEDVDVTPPEVTDNQGKCRGSGPSEESTGIVAKPADRDDSIPQPTSEGLTVPEVLNGVQVTTTEGDNDNEHPGLSNGTVHLNGMSHQSPVLAAAVNIDDLALEPMGAAKEVIGQAVPPEDLLVPEVETSTDQLFRPGASALAVFQDEESSSVSTVILIESPFAEMLERWQHRYKTTDDVRDTLSISVVCYSSADINDIMKAESTGPNALLKVLNACRRSWPTHGRLSLGLWFNGSKQSIPISPPFLPTHDQFLDVSMFIRPGENVVDLDQWESMAGYTFMLLAHYPTSTQLAEVEARRKANSLWHNALSTCLKFPPY